MEVQIFFSQVIDFVYLSDQYPAGSDQGKEEGAEVGRPLNLETGLLETRI